MGSSVFGLTSQAIDPNEQSFRETRCAGCGGWILDVSAHAPKPGQAQSGKFHCAGRILCAVLVVDGELLTSQNTVLGVVGEFEPKRDSGVMVAPALGKKSELAVSARPKFGWKAEAQRLRACDVGAIGLATPLEEPREAEQIEAVYSIPICGL